MRKLQDEFASLPVRDPNFSENALYNEHGLPAQEKEMFVDSSALLAIILREPDAWFFEMVLEEQFPHSIGDPTLVEATTAVVRRVGIDGGRTVRGLIQKDDIRVVDFDLMPAAVASQAPVTYGKGTAPAALNFGDCLAYGLAESWGAALLCKGNDFPLTDLPILTSAVS